MKLQNERIYNEISEINGPEILQALYVKLSFLTFVHISNKDHNGTAYPFNVPDGFHNGSDVQ